LIVDLSCEYAKSQEQKRVGRVIEKEFEIKIRNKIN